MKKIWIILIVVLLILAIGTVALLIFGGSSEPEKIDSGDETSLYPYYYQNTKDGLLITVKGKTPKNCKWTAESMSTYIASVEEKKQSSSKSQFLVKPYNWGNTQIILSLENTDAEIAAREYELEVDIKVATDKTVTVTNCTHRESLASTAETADFTYQILSNNDGSLELYADNNSACRWTIQVDGDKIAASPVMNNVIISEVSETVQYHLEWLGAGTEKVHLISYALGKEIVMEIDSDAARVLHLGNHQVVDYVPPVEAEEDSSSQSASYESVMGELKMPEEAELDYAEAVLWTSKVDETVHDAGHIAFRYSGVDWSLYCSDTAKDRDFYADREATVAATQEITEVGRTATVFEHSDGCFALWQSDSGRTWFLTAPGASARNTLATTKLLLLKAVD